MDEKSKTVLFQGVVTRPPSAAVCLFATSVAGFRSVAVLAVAEEEKTATTAPSTPNGGTDHEQHRHDYECIEPTQ